MSLSLLNGQFFPQFLFCFVLLVYGTWISSSQHALWHSRESQSKLLTELLVASLAFDPTGIFLLKFGGGTGWLEGKWKLWSMGGVRELGRPTGRLPIWGSEHWHGPWWSSEFLHWVYLSVFLAGVVCCRMSHVHPHSSQQQHRPKTSICLQSIMGDGQQ